VSIFEGVLTRAMQLDADEVGKLKADEVRAAMAGAV
jgi:hypothetical protein